LPVIPDRGLRPLVEGTPMATRGRLDEISLPDLLQILAEGGRTGKLTLSHRDGFGVVLFRNGRVIYAASNHPREAFGSILVSRNLVSPEALHEALEIQNRSAVERRLGAILVELGELSDESLREVMRSQVGEVIRDLISWRDAYFKFQNVSIPDRGEVEVDYQDLVLEPGLSTEGVLINAMRAAPSEDDEEPGQDRQASVSAASIPPRGEPLSLRQVMAEVRSPAFTGEISLQILRYASQVLRRGVLFSLGQNHARGLGQFGVDGGGELSGDELVRHLEISLEEPSVLAEVADSQELFKGPPVRTEGNERLAEGLGGVLPPEVVVIPILVNGTVAFALYGDNVPERRPIGSTEGLELLMIEAGLAIEKAVLEARLDQIEDKLA